MRRLQTPSQTVGPFFNVGLTSAPMNRLWPASDRGERIRIEGSVFDGAGLPVSDAMIEIWHGHPAFRGFGRAETTSLGTYFFETLKPGATQAADGRWQAPHLSIAVFARGMLLHAFSRLYFSDDPRMADDPLLLSIDLTRRRTLVAERRGHETPAEYVWDIHLQGDRETVFLDL